MIKCVIFDLDGVLVSTKSIHFDTLNEALSSIDSKYVITENEHLTMFDGLKTQQKLDLLTNLKGLPASLHSQIWELKQKLTIEQVSLLTPSEDIIFVFKKLKEDNIRLACCSNSIRRSVLTILAKKGLIEFMDLILSNEDVKSAKPHPEIYWKAMSMMQLLPEETLIVEDSPQGLLSAARSGAHVLRVDSEKDITYNNIQNKINTKMSTSKPKWQNSKMNVLIPMAGAGSRFQQAGYTFPKPLIDINGKPMIQFVIDNINIDANYIFVVQKEHRVKYNLDTLLNLIAPKCKIVEVDALTEGAACTTLLAKEYINNDEPLLIANSDQYVEWDSNEFMYKMIEQKVDAGIITFQSTHPKWSFAKTDEKGYVIEVAEKKAISDIATAGIYYWAKGSDYVKYAEQMIQNNTRINNEFYVCPVFNEAIADNKKIKTYNIQKMWGLGTPEDLQEFQKKFNF
jgi:beta-phosphoglucomutase-like phosphatase (HAD superfamily)/dTDP-glucose pyrophosphorylase